MVGCLPDFYQQTDSRCRKMLSSETCAHLSKRRTLCNTNIRIRSPVASFVVGLVIAADIHAASSPYFTMSLMS
jgi:hypothetical protein